MLKLSRIYSLAILLLVSGCSNSSETIGKFINDYNFIQLVPASNIYQAGSIIYRENYNPSIENPKKTFIGSLCIDKYAVGRYPEKPRESSSVSRELSRLNNLKVNLDGPSIKDIFNLNFTAEASENVTLTISDLKVRVYSKEDLYRIRGLLGKECRRIINDNIEFHNNAYQVRETLTASVKFVVELKANVGANLKQSVLKELGSFGAVATTGSRNTVVGDGLVYGIKWDKIRRKL